MRRRKKRMLILFPVAVVAVAVILFTRKMDSGHVSVPDTAASITVTSPAIEESGGMPDRHTGRGEDLSPPLQLSPLPEGCVTLAVIMDDLDIPLIGAYTHWVIWNLPPEAQIPEGIAHGATVPDLGAVQGIAWGRHRYRGPLPPFGTHRYRLHVFALDCSLDLDSTGGKQQLLAAMDGHILGYGALTGWYPTAK